MRSSIEVLRRMSPKQVQVAIDAFPTGYASDWERWLAPRRTTRLELFEAILQNWHACRPSSVRLARPDLRYEAPFLVDLLKAARKPLHTLGDLDVRTIGDRTVQQDAALVTLWGI